MEKINISIEIISSSIPSLSSMSQKSRDAILALLSLHYENVSVVMVNTIADLEQIAARKPDLVVLGMKFVPANPALGINDPHKIWVSEFLDNSKIAYTGSNQLAHELELDKSLAKQCVLDAGLATSPFYVAMQNPPQLDEAMMLSFPLFVKPTNRGGGLGIDANSVVYNFEQLNKKVLSLSDNYGSDSLVEQYLSGREFSVAILKDELSDNYTAMPLELIAPANEQGVRLLSEQVKSSDAERVIPLVDLVLRAKITNFALAIFKALGARDYGRIDIRLDAFGTPQFLEANLLPSLIAGYGSFPKACVMNSHLEYEPMILRIVKLGLVRRSANIKVVTRPNTVFSAIEAIVNLPSSKNVAISASE